MTYRTLSRIPRPKDRRERRAVAAGVAGRRPDQSLTPNAPLVPRHLKLHDLFPGEDHKATDPVTRRRLVLGNGDVRIYYAVPSATSPITGRIHQPPPVHQVFEATTS